MTEQEQVESKLSEAFHLMCDGMPEPAQLCHRTHRIIAVNPAGASYGRIPGEFCSRGCPGLKAGLCRQAQMRKSGATTWFHMKGGEEGRDTTTFWIPVSEHPDYYLHFGVGVTIDYSVRPTEEPSWLNARKEP